MQPVHAGDDDKRATFPPSAPQMSLGRWLMPPPKLLEIFPKRFKQGLTSEAR
jgi:hypothetical protein